VGRRAGLRRRHRTRPELPTRTEPALRSDSDEWVKSTMQRSGAGYRCQYTPNYKKKRDYSLDQIDLFAACVIPRDAWYLIPAAVLLGRRRIMTTTLCPLAVPKKKASYRYECYREAWNLLTKSRIELAHWQLGGSPKPVFLAPGVGRKPESRREDRK
jgi:hypothetical protein